MFGGYKYIDCFDQCPVDLLVNSRKDQLSRLEQPYYNIAKIFKVLKKSPTASYLLKEITTYNFNIVCDDQLSADTAGFHDNTSTLILPVFDDKIFVYKKNFAAALLTVASILRRALKSNQGHFHRFDLEPLEYLRLIRLVEADIDAVTIQIAWELRTAGEPHVWRQILADDKGDLAVIFTNSFNRYPVGQFDGRVLRSVYRQWFADPDRVNAADHKGLELLDMALAHPEYFTVEGDQKLSKNDIRKLQKNLPFSSYLDGINVFGRWFDGLKDPFNQTHLHHILQDLDYIQNYHS